MLAVGFQAAAAVIALFAAVMAWRLERRLTRLRNGHDQMQKAAIALAESVSRAEATIRDMRDTGAEAGAELEDSIARARAVRDELRLLSPDRHAPTARREPHPQSQSRPLPSSLRPAGADLVETLKRAR